MEALQDFIGNDTVIIKKQEHIVSVIFRFIKGILIFLIFSSIIAFVTFLLTDTLIWSTIIVLVAFVISFLYVRIFYKDTFILVTDTKILKSVRNGIFSSHIIELPLSRVRQIRANNNWVFPKIFWYGDIEIQGYEENSNMYFKAMSQNKQAMSSISTAVEKMK